MSTPGSRRGGGASIVANPVLVGAVTTLVVIVAVFLAYNANNGLPFVPTRELNVQVQNAAELVKGNEVRQGGFRVGVVSDIKPVQLPDHSVGAELKLKLDKKVGAVPADSHVMIRPRSALGLKYVELTRGSGAKMIPDGGTLRVTQTSGEVELDEVYNMFDKPTRSASQSNLKEFGDAFAGRGPDLSSTIQLLPGFFGVLTPVASNLRDPRTQIRNFFDQIDKTVQTVAPVAGVQARLFTTMADTFAALDRNPQALKDTISKNPATLDAGTRSFRVQIPFLRDVAAFSRDLRPAIRELRLALPDLNSALEVGTPVTQRSVALYPQLQDTMGALRDLATAPTTNAALRGLTATVGTLQPTLRFLGPFITVCNTWNAFWTFTAEHLSAPSPQGTEQRAILNGASNQNNSFGSANSPVPANGEGVVPGTGAPQYLHAASVLYGHAVDASGNADCSYGQQGYIRKAFKYENNSPSPGRFNIAIDSRPNLGYNLGPTFAHYANGHGFGLNPNHVPPGETFTTEPGGIGAQLP